MAKTVAAAALLVSVSILQIARGQNVTIQKPGLRCYSCSFNQPCTETQVTCKEGEHCSMIRGHSDYKVHESIFKKGCISAKKCRSSDNISYWNNPFRVTYSCCSTDLCNTGISRAPHASSTNLPMLCVATVLTILFASLS
ncbi:lymphocyte antigen 6G6e-like [Rhineura floridana]|uniref:lymphocyte antigen 6G6e-like n=1 Tax=Rhineura floridana TaxID=261503 RepID=UPI002AC884CA|nr:lymphocyte antigen 6G6e-like [Rhineura floridana]